jgi:hypothetical protein
MDILFSADYSPMWSAIGTLAGAISSILAIIALIYSMTTFRHSLQLSHYSELDKMYADLLRTAVDKPHLCNPAATRNSDQVIEYDIYAFMVWNFLETIFDRCQKHDHLRETWYPVIDAENRKHHDWFKREDNRHKFKPSFYAFIEGEKFRLA